MAAPVAVARVAPTAIKIGNGYQALLAFGLDTNMAYYEISVGIPGMDTGDPVDTTTQLNISFRTMSPRTLVTLTPFQVGTAYAARAYLELFNQLGIEQTFTILFPDLSTLSFYAFLRLVEYQPLVDGTMPQLTLTIVPTNYDPVHCVEAGPVLVDNGTC